MFRGKNVPKNPVPKIEDFTIRFAEEKDAATLFGLIKELAKYEKLTDKFEATERLIRESLFQHRFAEALIGEYGGKPVAYAVFFHNFSTFEGRPGIYVEDIYIKPELRGEGFGKALFAFIAKLAVKRGCVRLEWTCLNWNLPSIEFYMQLGAEQLADWSIYRLTKEKLEQIAQDI